MVMPSRCPGREVGGAGLGRDMEGHRPSRPSAASVLLGMPIRTAKRPRASRTEVPRLLTLHGFADALDIHYRTAALWARLGRIRSVRVGRMVRIPADEVARLCGLEAS